MKCVRIHCGSAHVRGKARKYSYIIASLFASYKTKDGRWIWRNTGISTKPRRGKLVCISDAKNLAKKYGCEFTEGYGSLHNKEIVDKKLLDKKLRIKKDNYYQILRNIKSEKY